MITLFSRRRRNPIRRPDPRGGEPMTLSPRDWADLPIYHPAEDAVRR